MNKYIYILILLNSIIGCRNNAEIPNIKADSIKYDTTIIDYNITNDLNQSYDHSLAQLSIKSLIDTLKSISELTGINLIDESSLPFTINNNSKYYQQNIPSRVYKLIFPNEEIATDKTRFVNHATVNDNRVTIQNGLRIVEHRKYKTLLSLIEKDNYLQLLITKQGKYNPGVDLITISKVDLEKIDYLNLYGGIYDSYDINYCYSIFDSLYNQIVKTQIRNTKFEDIQLDTITMKFIISNDGIINKK